MNKFGVNTHIYLVCIISAIIIIVLCYYVAREVHGNDKNMCKYPTAAAPRQRANKIFEIKTQPVNREKRKIR